MLTSGDVAAGQLRDLLGRFGLELQVVEDGADIAGSYWGEPEAGLVGHTVYARCDTPLHSLLHETCHYVCMTPARRAQLHTNAGGDYAEEDAVCYMQIVLADYIDGASRARMCADMDAWGYTFRLGSAALWFQQDAEDAVDWLRANDLMGEGGAPTWRLRGAAVSV